MIDRYTSIDDLSWYFVCYSDGESVCSIELGLFDDVFVPSEIKQHIQSKSNLDYCCLINWKKLDVNQVSTEVKAEFQKVINNELSR